MGDDIMAREKFSNEFYLSGVHGEEGATIGGPLVGHDKLIQSEAGAA